MRLYSACKAMTEESMRTRFDTGSRRSLAGLGLVLLSVVLLGVGCSQYEPFEPTPIDEIPDGPGLFTGKTGKWSIVSMAGCGHSPVQQRPKRRPHLR